jgi:hypothetical protein
MAKKQYTGAKVTVVVVSAAALVYGTAWFSLARSSRQRLYGGGQPSATVQHAPPQHRSQQPQPPVPQARAGLGILMNRDLAVAAAIPGQASSAGSR